MKFAADNRLEFVPDLSVSANDVFVAVEFFQPHGASGVQFLGGDPHFAAETELAAVGKARRNIDVNRRGVNQGGELCGVIIVLRQDRVAVSGGMLCNVCNGGIGAVHHGYGEDVIKKFRIKVAVSGRSAGDDFRCAGVKTEFYGNETLCRSVFCQTLPQFGQEVFRDIFVNQQNFFRIADRGTAGFCIFDDVESLILIGRSIHKDVADAGSRLNAGNLGVFGAVADETGAAAAGDRGTSAIYAL